MFIDRLRVKDNLEEILGHSSKPFPHTSYYVEPEKFPGGIYSMALAPGCGSHVYRPGAAEAYDEHGGICAGSGGSRIP